MTGNTATLDDLADLAREVRDAYDEIQEVRYQAEHGNIGPHEAAKRANAILSDIKKTTI